MVSWVELEGVDGWVMKDSGNSTSASAPFAFAIPEDISCNFFSKKDLVSGLNVLIVPPNLTLSSITL